VENVNLRPASARELSCFFLKKKLPFDKKNVYLSFQKSIHIAQERRLKHTIFNDLPDYRGWLFHFQNSIIRKKNTNSFN
jgi:hypothetical protein